MILLSFAILGGCTGHRPAIPGAFGTPATLCFRIENRGSEAVELWLEFPDERLYLGGIEPGRSGEREIEWERAREFRVLLTQSDGDRYTLREVRGVPRGLLQIVTYSDLFRSRISVLR